MNFYTGLSQVAWLGNRNNIQSYWSLGKLWLSTQYTAKQVTSLKKVFKRVKKGRKNLNNRCGLVW